jgi:hypothetical protein
VANPPPDRFDPCRAWLGIDRADLADPRRVLGLVPGEADPIVVLKAAETRLKALKGLAAGQHHAAREALILQVEQAREKVLSQIAAVGNGQAPPGPSAQGSGFSMPPPPRRHGLAATDAEAGATVVFDEPDGSESEAEDAFAPPVVRVRRYRAGRRQGSAAIWASLLAILGSVAAGVGFIWWQARQQDLRQAGRSQATRSLRDEDLAGVPQGDAPARSKPLPEDAAISSSPPPSRPEGMKPITPSTSRPAPPVKTPPTTSVAAPTPEPTPEPAFTEPMETAPAEPQPSLDTVASMDGDAPPEEMMTDAGMPGDAGTDMPADDEMASADSTDASEIETAIASALSAIRTSDFDTADVLLASALEGGRSMPAKRRVSDWQTLAQYAREFAGFREKAIAAVKPGDEYDVNGKKVGVVEIDDKKFIYRFQGRNKTTPRNKIPAGIAMAIVTTWFDDRPANHLFLGAHHATKPEPDLAKARDQWERAEQGGINAEPLIRLLDDPLLQEGAKASEPTDE